MMEGDLHEILCQDYGQLLSNLSVSGHRQSIENQSMNANYTALCGQPSTSSSAVDYMAHFNKPVELSTLVIVIIYGLISAIGLLGNALVIFVIARYTKMKTVTNMYIVNLSLADGLFLLGLPMVMTTGVMRRWVFGMELCKVYYILTCINMFTSAFTLTVMAGDRYMAACYPITSIQYRTPKYAMLAIVVTWLVSFIVMMPVVLYANISGNQHVPDVYSCTIKWPAAQAAIGQKIFLTYTLLLGFVIPITLITILYSLIIINLSTGSNSAQTRSAQRRRSHRKVTKLVTLIISVYIIFWLPYWAFQIDLIVNEGQVLAQWKFNMFKMFTVLSYANSMINPLLYAFTNQTFREAFIGAFKCASDHMIGGGRRGSDFPSAVTNNIATRMPVVQDTFKAPLGAFLDPNDCEVTMLTATASGQSLNVATQTEQRAANRHKGSTEDNV